MRDGNLNLQFLVSDLILHNEAHIDWHQQKNFVTIKKKISREKKRNALLEMLYYALHARCLKQPPPAFHEWISTRELAEDCKLGIYQTRTLLLKLVEQQRIIVTPTPISNSLRWYIVVEGNTSQSASELGTASN